MPADLVLWEKIVAWTVTIALFAGGPCVCYWLVRRVVRAFHEGLRGEEEGRR